MKLPEIYGNKIKEKKGFTLIELLITVTILGIVTAGGIGLLSRYTETTQLHTAHTELKQAVRIAYTRSQVGLNQSAHGIYFEPHMFTVFQGSSYATRDTVYDWVVRFNNALSLSASFPGNELVFSEFSALPNATGTITILHSVHGQEIIFVNQLGLIE